MDARPLATGAAPATATGEPLARLAIGVALATGCLLAAVSALFLGRRLAGGFSEGPTPLVFLASGGVLLAAGCALRLSVWNLPPAGGRERLRLAFLLLPAAAVVMLAASLTFNRAPIWPLAVVWLAIALEEGTWWTLYIRSRWRWASPVAGLQPAATPTPADSPTALREPGTTLTAADEPRDDLEAEFAGEPEPIAENIIQQMTRLRGSEGESLYGMLRGDFSPGERTQNLHLAFCPPLARAPEFSFEQVAGPPTSIKAAQVESFGVRLEVRLSSSLAEPASVLIEFSAK